MDPIINNKKALEVVSPILQNIIQGAIEYSTMDPLKELLNRTKIESTLSNFNQKIRVMSYNLMADSLSDPNLEVAKPFELKYVDWKSRSSLIISEINAYNPDIVCLQEIDQSDAVISSAFQNDYDLFFRSRTNDKRDGCLTMIKKTTFSVIEKHYIEYYVDQKNPLLNRDNVCTITIIKPKDQQHQNDVFFVVNTHILFSDGRGDIKTSQIHLAIETLYQLAESIRFKKSNVHIFYAGDFNIIPNSAIYELISRGKFDFREMNGKLLTGQKLGNTSLIPNFKKLGDFLSMNVNKYRFNLSHSEQKRDLLYSWITYLKRISVKTKIPENNEPSKVEFLIDYSIQWDPDQENTYILYNKFFMLSAYSAFQNYYFTSKFKKVDPEFFLPKYSTYEPFYTCRTVGNLMTVDYIWFFSLKHVSNSQLQVRGVIIPPNSKQLQRVSTFPNRIYPSDHFSLISDFVLL